MTDLLKNFMLRITSRKKPHINNPNKITMVPNSKSNQKYCKVSKSVEEENNELQRLHDFFIKSLNNAKKHDIPPTFNMERLKQKLENTLENCKKRNIKIGNKQNGGAPNDNEETEEKEIRKEVKNILTTFGNDTNDDMANGNNNDQLGLPINNDVANSFVDGIRNRTGTYNHQTNNMVMVNQGNSTNITANVGELGLLALQQGAGNEDLRQQAIQLLFEKEKLKIQNARDTLKDQRARIYLANIIFLISFIGGMYLTQQTWVMFSQITNVTGDLNALTAPPAPTPSPSWFDVVTNPFRSPPPAPVPAPPPPTWWDWISGGGSWTVTRIVYMLHVVTSLLHELLMTSQVGATFCIFFISTLASIALYHAIKGGCSCRCAGFGVSVGENHNIQQITLPQLQNQQMQNPPQLQNQNQQMQNPPQLQNQQQLQNPRNTNRQHLELTDDGKKTQGGYKRRKKKSRKKHKKKKSKKTKRKSKQRKKTKKRRKKRKTKSNKK